MKSLLTVLFSVTCLCLYSQVPQAINYQAIARNVNGSVIPNQHISVELSVRDGSPTASIVYQEIDTATTNQFGLFTLAIGTGQVQVGSFTSINWSTGNKYIQVGFDPAGGTSFTNMGATELLSVPYALYATSSSNAGAVTDYAVYNETTTSGTPCSTTLSSGTWTGRQINNSVIQAGSNISRSGNTITLQAGTYYVKASAMWGWSIPYNSNYTYSAITGYAGLRVQNTSNSSTLISGKGQNLSDYRSTLPSYTFHEPYEVNVDGVFTISSATTISLQHYLSYTSSPPSTAGFDAGLPASTGEPETYSTIYR